MLVHVTEKHIKDGKPRRSKECPLAMAIKEAGNYSLVTVGVTAVVVNRDVTKRLELPESAAMFRHDFDMNLPVQPFSFELEDYSGSNAI